MASTTYRINLDASQAISALNGLKAALGGVTAALGVRTFINFADDITNLRNKLLTLTPSLDVVNKQFTALAAIAINARTPLEATADLFFRIQRSAKALGISQREAAQITESVAKALTASGQSASEASGPLLQLGQALQSGSFQGDELRSILEGLPQVAQALAQELNVPVGALKKLGSEGQISADVFVRAMRRAKDSIDEAFGRTTPSITQSLEQLKTVTKLAFDEFEKNTKTGRSLGQMIEYITVAVYNSIKSIDDFIDRWGSTIVTIGKVILAFTAFKFIASLVAGITSAIGAFGSVVGAVTGSVVAFSTRIGALSQSLAGPFAKILEWLVGKFASLTGSVGHFISILSGGVAAIYAWLKLGEVGDIIDDLKDSTSSASKEIEDFKNQQKGAVEGLDDAASASENAAAQAKELAKQYAKLKQAAEFELDNLNRSLAQERDRLALENKFTQLRTEGVGNTQDQLAVDQARQRVAQDMYNAQMRINQEIQKLNLEYSQLAVKDSVRGREIRNQVSVLQYQREENKKIYSDHEEGMAKLIQDQLNLKSIEEARRKIQEDIVSGIDREIQKQQSLDEIIRSLNREISDTQQRRPEFATVGFSSLEKQLLKIEDDTKRAAQRAAEAFAQGFGEITPMNESEFADGLAALQASYAELLIVQQEVAKEQYNIQRSFIYGWKDAFSKFSEDAMDKAKEAKGYFETFTRGFENAIVKFVQTGKLSFKDLITDMLVQFARIQANRMMFNFLGASGLGSIFGGSPGAGASILGLPGFAKGGYLPSGQMGVVGENGPEFITGPANISPMDRMGKSVNVTYNINAVDAASFRSLVARDPQFIYSVTEAGRRSQPGRRLA
jgi:lambda family phage tail tape measure protein